MPEQVHRQAARPDWPISVGRRSSSASGWRCTPSSPAPTPRSTNRRRLADSARNALLACFGSTLIAAIVLASALVRHDFTLRLRRRAHEPRPADALRAERVLGRPGGLAAALAARAHRLRRARRRGQPPAAARPDRVGRAGDRRHRDLLRVHARRRLEPVPDADARRSTAPASRRACRTRTWSPTRRCSTSATSASRSRSRSPPARCSPGRTDERWIVATRRWTLAAWMFLGIGQLLGSHWAYVEVGWGGYYAWDPVENAALMPWLAATAFLHSVMVQERKGMLKIWNMVLVALAFELSILGTFLTRSGVINSIHSFAKSSIGAWFLFFVVVTALFSTRADPVAAAAAAREDEARVAALARGDVPLQQPAARRALPDDPLGRHLPDPDRPVPEARRARSGGRTSTSSCASSGCRCCC